MEGREDSLAPLVSLRDTRSARSNSPIISTVDTTSMSAVPSFRASVCSPARRSMSDPGVMGIVMGVLLCVLCVESPRLKSKSCAGPGRGAAMLVVVWEGWQAKRCGCCCLQSRRCASGSVGLRWVAGSCGAGACGVPFGCGAGESRDGQSPQLVL